MSQARKHSAQCGAAIPEYILIVAIMFVLAVAGVRNLGLNIEEQLYAGGGTLTSMSPGDDGEGSPPSPDGGGGSNGASGSSGW